MNISNMKIFIHRWVLTSMVFTIVMIMHLKPSAQTPGAFLIIRDPKTNVSAAVSVAKPLDELLLVGVKGKQVQVSDGAGENYFVSGVRDIIPFTVGGTLGTHSVSVISAGGRKTVLFRFRVNAATGIDDGGYYKKMFDLFYKGMDAGNETGIKWNGKYYRYFEPWVLDHCQNMMGLKYFLPYGSEFVDLMRQTQRKDGMIYSFVQTAPNADYFFTRDKLSGYTQQIGDRVFTRQPTENHPEYLFVNTVYQCWQATADDAWMENNLVAASRALDYTLHDPARWSNRFGLLKRVYTIDSWDFAVEDEYTPDLGITNSMMIDPVKSKFGIFFGDNTGYIAACYQLAEMLEHAGRRADASVYRLRGDTLKERLDALSWNGKYFTHFVEEDSMVVRHLGVDEKSQIAQSNAYSLNRDISSSQSKAIIETYLELKNRLPMGSPGEWYAIYPPFPKGFNKHDTAWQYMNGGVGGHVAGELARGAYANGYENYGTDILNRLYELGKKYDNKIYFSYTGSIPPAPGPPVIEPLDLTAFANMDSWTNGDAQSQKWMNSNREGDDFRALPTGDQTFSNIRFHVIDPGKNNRKAVVAVSRANGLPSSVEIPVGRSAGAIYLLHTSSKPASENICGVVIFKYPDGSSRTNYIINGKQLTYWWFSELRTEYSGIAWYGKDKASEGIGLSWCVINNPEPQKQIASIVIEAAAGNGIYTVFAISLADRKYELPVSPVSFGGPDNWAAATAMAAMVEGLAGVKNTAHTRAYSFPAVSPRWSTTNSDSVNVCIRYAASGGYVAYRFIHLRDKKEIQILATGNGKKMHFGVLLPERIEQVISVSTGSRDIPFSIRKPAHSAYVDFDIRNTDPKNIIIKYSSGARS
jgi:hypothetical protein